MRLAGICVILVLAAAAGPVAQSADSAPTFEAASIKVSPPPETTPVVSAGPRPGGRWLASNADVLRLIRGAYPEFARPGRIVGEPSWAQTRFDVSAKAGDNVSFDELRAMAQSMLRDRFGFAFHVERRLTEVYALVRSGRALGRDVTPPVVDCGPWAAARAARQPDPPLPTLVGRPACGISADLQGTTMRVRVGGMTMRDVAAFFETWMTPTLEIVDRTESPGRFDMALDFTPQFSRPADAQAADPADGRSLSDAAEDHLGLKLERRREPVDVMVIDRVQMPTPD